MHDRQATARAPELHDPSPNHAQGAGLASGPLAGHALDRLAEAVQGLTAEQLTWCSGWLAGLAAANGGVGGPVPAPAQATSASAAVRLTILHASQTGNARGIAERLGRLAAGRGLAHRVLSAADLRPRDLARERLLLLVVSTHGEGEPPDAARELHRWLHGPRAPDLSDLAYGVLALGDSSYEQFCQAGRDFDERLAALGARRLLDRVEADVDFQPVADGWAPAALERVEAELPAADRGRDAEVVPLRQPLVAPVAGPLPSAAGRVYDRDRPYRTAVLDSRPLTMPDAVTQVRHLALEVDPAALAWSPGDSVGVWFRNDAGVVAELLELTGLDGDAGVEIGGDRLALAEALGSRLELSRLHPAVATAWAGLAGAEDLWRLAGDKANLRAWCREHQVVDLLCRWPARLGAAELVGLLQPLAPRLYSIASAAAGTGDELHLTVSTLRWQCDGRERGGAASGYLAERIEAGAELDIYLAENPAFRLPADGDTPIVMVAAGTGIAPFRAFMQQRAASGDRGRNWLVFGSRHVQRDFLYQADWLRLRADGLLSRFSPAFSRDAGSRSDAAGRCYVQDRLRAEGAELWRWLADGARLYVCGATAMEAGVRTALADIAHDHGGLAGDAAQAFPETLRAEGRYLRDTY